jgi:hypothetical protein
LIFVSDSFSQQQNVPLRSEYLLALELELNGLDTIQHLGFLPLLQSRLRTNKVDKLVENLGVKDYSKKSFVSRKLFHEHVIQYDSGAVTFTIDPIVNFEFGKENSEFERDESLYKNVRGFILRLNLGSKVSIESTFRENQVELSSYLHNRTNSTRVAYGQGRVKTFKDSGFDFSMATSVINYSPNNRVNIQLGNGKQFVGYGHRSILLSDMAFSYPFIKLNTSWLKGKIQYQNMYSIFQNLSRLDSDFEGEGLFERKQGAIHYLDFAVNSKFNIGLFEGTIWSTLDSSGNTALPLNYYAPVIFLNSLIEKNSKEENNLIGVNSNYKVLPNFHLYGQLALNGISNSNSSYQLGAKYYLKQLPLKLQAEYDSKGKQSKQTLFTHYEESLTTPYNIEAQEVYFSATYKIKRILSQVAINQIITDLEEIQFINLKQSYIVNPSYNLALSLGVHYRIEHVSNHEMNYIYLGLSTNLQNIYFNY